MKRKINELRELREDTPLSDDFACTNGSLRRIDAEIGRLQEAIKAIETGQLEEAA